MLDLSYDRFTDFITGDANPSATPPLIPTQQRGGARKIRITLREDADNHPLVNGEYLRLSYKPASAPDTSVPFSADFTIADLVEGTESTYEKTVSYYTSGLNALLNINDDPADDLLSAALRANVTHYDVANVELSKSEFFGIAFETDYGRPTDGTPLNEPNARDIFLANDVAQDWTDDQKAQARANLGALSSTEAPVTSVAGRTGAVTLNKGDVSLGLVDNTSDAGKPISTATQTALDLKAPLGSPALTGTPTAPTASSSTNSTQLATTAFVQGKINDLVNGAPGLLDTLKEIADQLALDESAVAALATTVAGKAPLTSPALTGSPTAPTATVGDNSTKLATTAFVVAAVALVGGGSSAPTGATFDFVGTAAPSGYVVGDGTTIGDGSSGASQRANADTSALFALLWNTYADAQIPVSGGRGANAAADFAAHKKITLPDFRGRGAVPQGGTAFATLGDVLGEEQHTLVTGEMPSHTHDVEVTVTTNAGGAVGISGGGDDNAVEFATGATASGGATTTSVGSDSPHNNIQPSIVIGCKIIKL